MPDAWLRKLLTVATTSVVLVAILRVLRGDPAPQFADRHDAPDGARPALVPAPTDPTVLVPPAAPSAGAPSAERPLPAPAGADPVDDLHDGSGQGELHLVPAVAASSASTTESSGTWAEPIDGSCPPGFPVKAKLISRIFHMPGGLSYDRTKPDRCYRTPAGAEADGLRAAKR